MNFDKIIGVYFLGIGGIGMSALARYFNAMGKMVSGYDATPTDLTRSLENEGIEVYYTESEARAKSYINTYSESHLIIYTPAIPKINSEWEYFKNNATYFMKRAEVLGLISKNHKTIAVAGTHGKTTITSIIAHIFKSVDYPAYAFIGGVSKNLNSNLWLTQKTDQNPVLIVEADEYDKSFLQLNPYLVCISSIEKDHLDIYENIENIQETYTQFAQKTSIDGALIMHHSVDLPIKHKHVYYYGYDKKKQNIYVSTCYKCSDNQNFSINLYPDVIFSLQIDGRYNVENAVCAILACLKFNIDIEDIKNAIKTYTGVKRRFEYHLKTAKHIVIDDYAHHPTEIKSFVESVKRKFADKKITGIFQPHLFSRTRDFAGDFAQALSLLDTVVLLPIYPAREKPIDGINSAWLGKMIDKKEVHVLSKNQLIDFVQQNKPEVLLTIGAGDINELLPDITNILKMNNLN